MNLRISRALTEVATVALDWLNVPIWHRYIGKHHLELVRIDVALAAGFLLCTGCYGWQFGWLGAVKGSVMYAMVAFAAVCLRAFLFSAPDEPGIGGGT